MNIGTFLHSQTRELRSFNKPARLFLLAVIFDGIVYSAWSLFFNFYILERGYGLDFLGMVNAVPSLAVLISGLPMGRLSDRLGRKRSMVIGLGLSILFLAVEVSVSSPALILAAAFLANIAGALYFLSQAPFMMRVSTPENRTLLFSLNYGLLTLAGAVGYLFAGQLPALFGSWLGASASSFMAYQAVLFVSVALSFGTLVPLLLIHEPAPAQGEEKRADQASLKDVLSRPLTWQLSLPNLGIGLGAALLIPYLNVFLAQRFQTGDQMLGLLFSLAALLTGLGSVVGPRLVRRMGGKIRAVVFTQVGSLVFLLVIGFTPLFPLVALAFLARSVLMNMGMPLYSAFVMEQVPEREQGTVNSVKELAWQSGYAVGPYVSGLVQQSYGFTPLFVATAVLYAVSSVVTWWFFHDREWAIVEIPVVEALGSL